MDIFKQYVALGFALLSLAGPYVEGVNCECNCHFHFVEQSNIVWLSYTFFNELWLQCSSSFLDLVCWILNMYCSFLSIFWVFITMCHVEIYTPSISMFLSFFLFALQPVGVVGAITPWNFPLAMITRKVSSNAVHLSIG